MRYHQVLDGDWVEAKKIHYIKCCDCGLTHRVNFKVIKGKIWFRAFRLRKRK